MNEASIIESNGIASEMICIPVKNRDGVFSNLNAKPEVSKLEQIGQYMDKPPTYSQAALNMPPTYQDALDDFSIIESMLVGKLILFYFWSYIFR